MQYLPLIVFAAIIVVFIAYAGRQRRRQQAVLRAAADAITVGTEVMTTSGLHGTVVVRNDDETVMLAIAPGVEVKWEVAALRDVASLPGQVGAGPAPRTVDPSVDKAADSAADPSVRPVSPYDPPADRPAD